jgi:cyclase
MRRVSPSVFTEIYFWGCNPGFIVSSDGILMVDTPQQPIDAVRWREAMAEHGKPLYLVNTEWHPDHIRGNAYFPGVEVLGHVKLQQRYNEVAPSFNAPDMVERMKIDDPDSVWLMAHPDYPPNPITRPFEDGMTLEMGNHRIELIHMPGHTAPQTSVFVPSEGIVFTGDNVFHKCRTFVQEGDPWQWLEALESIRALDVETIVPGHGEPCDKRYLDAQGQILRDWVGAMETMVDKGMTEDEALKQPCPEVDPYPIGQHLFARNDFVTEANMRNVYRRIMERRAAAAR